MHFKHIIPRLRSLYSNTFDIHFHNFFPIFSNQCHILSLWQIEVREADINNNITLCQDRFHAHTQFKRSPSTTDPSSNDEKKSCNSKTVKRNKLHLSSGKHIKFLQWKKYSNSNSWNRQYFGQLVHKNQRHQNITCLIRRITESLNKKGKFSSSPIYVDQASLEKLFGS